ncbi:MAG: ATP-binding protein [Ramlibacter sp.]|nr:ATP-binding protein [Ramlibacter sp.]MCW5650899.1 ATP-binding protein [Ramlibacter sp.]
MVANTAAGPAASPSAPAGEPPVLRRQLASVQADIPLLCEDIERWGEPLGVPPATLQALSLMLDELITNTIIHGFQGDPGHAIDVVLTRHADEVEVVLRDTAPAFDPRSIAPPDTTADVAQRDIGGLGIHLVRRLSDSFSYRRDGDANEVTLRKALNGPPRARESAS